MTPQHGLTSLPCPDEQRSSAFARNPLLEGVLSLLGDALQPSAVSADWRVPTRPIVFVIGPPRSGSTYLMQRLASTGTFGYPSNIVARFHMAPYVGALTHRLLVDPDLDYRGELEGIDPSIRPSSSLGKTHGPANVNEFWYAWRPHLPSTGADQFTDAEVAEIDRVGLQAMLAALEAGFDRPLALKAQLLAFHAEVLGEIFPSAVFLRLRRRADDVVGSILGARERHTGSIESWWSLRPHNLQDLLELSPVDQVRAQVSQVEDALDGAANVLGDRIVDVDFDELTANPEGVDHQVCDRLHPIGIHMGPVSFTPQIDKHPVAAHFTPDPSAGPADRPHQLLYTTPSFGRRNLAEGEAWLEIDHHDGGRFVGSLSGTLTGNLFWSGCRAPFGGPDLVREVETPANVTGLLGRASAVAQSEGADTIRITLRPPSYSDNEALLLHCATRLGFRPVHSELSCAIDVAGLADRSAYVAGLKRETRKALRRAVDEPWSYREVVDDWAGPYQLLERNRARKGRSLRLSLDYLRAVSDDHPGRLRLFELRHQDTAVAAALLYRLRDDVESVQYWGDDAPLLTFSPMTQLAVEVVTRAIEEHVRIVDLGKSSIDGVPDEGLVQFKRSIGAIAEPILTVERVL